MSCPVCGDHYNERAVVTEAVISDRDVKSCIWLGADVDKGEAVAFIHDSSATADEIEVEAHP